MAEQILKDATQLGSTLTSFASRQLAAVLDELRGPIGDGRTRGEGSGDGASIGSLVGNAMQIVGQVGSLLTQLSHYDLVRNDVNTLQLTSANPITSLSARPGHTAQYALLIENNGREAFDLVIVAHIHDHAEINFQEIQVGVGERRRYSIQLPPLENGKWTLIISAYDRVTFESKDRKLIARKTVALNVLPPPSQHTP